MAMRGILIAFVLLLLSPTAAHAAERETWYTVGDSITMGATLSDPFSERYPARLRNYGPRIRVVAHGNSCLIAKGCGYGARLVDTFGREVLSHRPDRVIIHIGVNDLAHATDAQLKHGYRLLRRQAKSVGAKVYIATVTPTARTFAMYPRGWVEPQRQRINRWIRRTWPNTYIDFAAALEGRGGAMREAFNNGDGLHPNALGAQALADAVSAKLLDGNP